MAHGSLSFKESVGKVYDGSENIYKNLGKTRFNMFQYRIKNHFEVKNRKRYLDQQSINFIEDKKFLYFPLASEPEAHILINSSFFSNQITLIENIAKSIPVDTVLYVKEHPIQKAKLWRPIEDYKKISSIPNVKLVHPNTNNQELIAKSQGVIVISGSTGFEALFHKKPVILFSQDHYDSLSMVTKIDSITNLPHHIRDSIQNFEFKPLENGVIPFDYLVSTLKEEGVVFEMDIHWVAFAGEDPVQWINKYPGMFPLWHVKDFAADTITQVPVGQGVLDWERIFSYAELSGMKHYYIEQDICSADRSLHCLKESIDWANSQKFME